MLQLETNPSLRHLPARAATAPPQAAVEWAVLAADLATVSAALVASGVTAGPAPLPALVTAGLMLAAWVLLGHYTTRQPFPREAAQILLTTLVALGLVLGGRALLGASPPASGAVVFALAACLALIAARVGVKYLLHRAGAWQIPTAVVGSAGGLAGLRLGIEADWYAGYALGETIDLAQPLEAVVRALDRRLADGRAGHVIIVFDAESCAAAQALADRLDRMPSATYSLVPPIRGLSFARLSLQRPFGQDGVLLHRERGGRGRSPLLLKRILDLILAAALLIALSPLMLLLAALVRADGAPAIYRSPRIGRNGREFAAYKFRSMVPDADRLLRALLARDPDARREWETQFKLTRDPRITPIGRFLRRTSLDELPQLVNVLKGEMSLVGPRPILPDELASYSEALAVYHGATPGITGMWQVCGRDRVDYGRRIHLNNWYCRNHTLWNDLVILFRTALVVFGRSGSS